MQALAEVQRRLWRLISAADGVAAALAAEGDAGGHGHPDRLPSARSTSSIRPATPSVVPLASTIPVASCSATKVATTAAGCTFTSFAVG